MPLTLTGATMGCVFSREALGDDARRCLAVADWLAGDASIVGCPDEARRNDPAVELIVDTAAGRLAMEHTRVEPFPNQLRDDRQLMAFYRPIADALRVDIPPAFRLMVQFHGRIPTGRRAAARQRQLTSWIRSKVPALEAGHPGSTRHVPHAEPPEVPLGVTLYRWSTGGGPSGINAVRSGKSEEERRERIVTALKQKTPKLLANAGEFDAHPVLVLDRRRHPAHQLVADPRSPPRCVSRRRRPTNHRPSRHLRRSVGHRGPSKLRHLERSAPLAPHH